MGNWWTGESNLMISDSRSVISGLAELSDKDRSLMVQDTLFVEAIDLMFCIGRRNAVLE